MEEIGAAMTAEEAVTVETEAVETVTVETAVETVATGDHPRTTTTIVVAVARMTETAEISPRSQAPGRALRSKRMAILP